MASDKTCSNCRFWASSFECRRSYPRVPLPGQERLWPLTAPDDWCGSWGGVYAPKEVGAPGAPGRPQKHTAAQLVPAIRQFAWCPERALPLAPLWRAVSGVVAINRSTLATALDRMLAAGEVRAIEGEGARRWWAPPETLDVG